MPRAISYPIITHTEIYSRAIRTVEAEINAWKERCEGLPPDQANRIFSNSTEQLREKLDALKTLYRIECGSEYV